MSTVNNGPQIVRSGLVLNLDANKTTSYIGTGTNWVDISGNGNNGNLLKDLEYKYNFTKF